ncbi:MAG: helix-turn-helix domain-containing protein [Paludibacter sp.]
MKSLIIECLESGADVTLNVKATDLREFAQLLMCNAAREASELQRKKDEEVYYSVEDVMSILNVKDRSTMWRWQQKDYLTPVKVGKMVRYRKSDVEAILSNGKELAK